MHIREWAKINNMSPDEFKKEILTFAACLGAMDLDERGATEEESMRFTTKSDDKTIELYVRYKP